jgi:CDP-glucose 4,6-dehydratase
VAEKIKHLMGSELELEVQNQAVNEIRHQYLSAEKARKVLDWRPLFTLEAGLERTIDWYRSFFHNQEKEMMS